MKKLIAIILVVSVSVVLGLSLKDSPGYVLISYKSWVVELSVWTAMICIILSFLVLHKLINFSKFILNLPGKTNTWLQKRREQKELNKTSMGLLKLAEGNYKQALNLLIKSAKYNKAPLINYLTAAKAAQQLDDIDRRDQYLKLAYECSPKSGLSIGLMQANLQLSNHEYEAALATLNNLEQKYGINKVILKQQYSCYYNLKDWNKLAKLTSELIRYKALPVDEIKHNELWSAINYFNAIANNQAESNTDNFSTLTQKVDDFYYKEISKKARLHPQVVKSYVKSLLGLFERADDTKNLNKNNELYIELIEKLTSAIDKSILANLDSHDDDIEHSVNELFEIYSDISCTDQHFNKLEKHLKHKEYNIDLLFNLGRLAIKLQDYDRAYQYLNQVQKISNNSDQNKRLSLDYYMSYVLLKLGKTHDSIELLEQVF